MRSPVTTSATPLDGKVILLTGATDGLGLAPFLLMRLRAAARPLGPDTDRQRQLRGSGADRTT